jgi:hypothetical protein
MNNPNSPNMCEVGNRIQHAAQVKEYDLCWVPGPHHWVAASNGNQKRYGKGRANEDAGYFG